MTDAPDKDTLSEQIAAAEQAAAEMPPTEKLIAQGKIDLLKAKLQIADVNAIAQAYAAGTADLPSTAEINQQIAAAKAATAREQDRVKALNWVLGALEKVLSL